MQARLQRDHMFDSADRSIACSRGNGEKRKVGGKESDDYSSSVVIPLAMYEAKPGATTGHTALQDHIATLYSYRCKEGEENCFLERMVDGLCRKKERGKKIDSHTDSTCHNFIK